MSQQDIILLLGTNLGDRKKNILTALEKIEKRIGKIKKESKIIETKPVEFCSSNNFYNFAVMLGTSFSPIKVLKLVKEIECEMGREEDSSVIGRFSDRIIDIDIVKYSNLFFECSFLQIPHQKHLKERDFSKQIIEELYIKA